MSFYDKDESVQNLFFNPEMMNYVINLHLKVKISNLII